MWESGCIFMSSPGDAGWCFWFQQRGWMKRLLRQQTHHPPHRERERERGRTDSHERLQLQRHRWTTVRGWGGGRRRKSKRWRQRDIGGEKECETARGGEKNRRVWRLKGAENWDNKEPDREQFVVFFPSLCLSQKNNSVMFKSKNKPWLLQRIRAADFRPLRWNTL